jgi:hypothetical protein
MYAMLGKHMEGKYLSRQRLNGVGNTKIPPVAIGLGKIRFAHVALEMWDVVIHVLQVIP